MKKFVNPFFIIFIIFLIILGGFWLLKYFSQPVKSASDDNVSGYAWSERIGWISFNCYNDYDADGTLESRCTDAGYDSDYGVNIDSGTGDFSGHAWAGGGEEAGADVATIGWISFDRSETGNPPSDDPGNGSGGIANLDSATGQVLGWMRALAACQDNLWDGTKCTGSGAGDAAGGWDGWIKLGDSSGNWYGTDQEQVTIDLITTELSGWAWGGQRY